MQYLSCCPAFQPAGAEGSLPLVQDKEGTLLHLLVGGREGTLGLQLPVLLHNQAEGGMQVGNHHQEQVDMLGDSPLLEAEEDMQDNPVVVQALGIPGQAAWDRAGLLAAWLLAAWAWLLLGLGLGCWLLAAWALHRQEVVH